MIITQFEEHDECMKGGCQETSDKDSQKTVSENTVSEKSASVNAPSENASRKKGRKKKDHVKTPRDSTEYKPQQLARTPEILAAFKEKPDVSNQDIQSLLAPYLHRILSDGQCNSIRGIARSIICGTPQLEIRKIGPLIQELQTQGHMIESKHAIHPGLDAFPEGSPRSRAKDKGGSATDAVGRSQATSAKSLRGAICEKQA